MRVASWCLSFCLLVGSSGSAFAIPSEFENFLPVKPIPAERAGGDVPSDPGTLVGGDTFTTAVPIASLPFNDTGNTCAFNHNYSLSCGGSGGRDVVYSLTPTTNMCVNVSLCGSGFDTGLSIYRNSTSNLVACNDDFCASSSQVNNLSLTAGNTYYIVVDGFSGADCGDYQIEVSACPACLDQPLTCPDGAIQENEPVCADGYADVTNPGCSSPNPAFTELPCDGTPVDVCATYGTFLGEGGGTLGRDTDWYELNVTTTSTIHVTVTGSMPTQLAILDGNGGCAAATPICGSIFGAAGETICCDATVAPGTYWIFVSTNGFTGFPCGSPYVMKVEGACEEPVPTVVQSWGKMKAQYR